MSVSVFRVSVSASAAEAAEASREPAYISNVEKFLDAK